MTLSMADSITVAALPAGYDAYLGYVDGLYNTAAALKARFPGSPLVLLTVTDTHPAGANGADVETGDLTQAEAGPWAAQAITNGVWRPVLYDSVDNMDAVVASLPVPRSSVRLLSAHYGAGNHICGPGTCGLVSVPMDGTQWSNSVPGAGGALIDVSTLLDDFFIGGSSMFIQIPGVPGEWLSHNWYYDLANGVPYVVGQGTDGQVWMTKFVGGAWTGPVVI
jgi:hypothetical protein